MDTSVDAELPGRRTHRRHGVEFKAQVVLVSRPPGVSMALVALANGLNANMPASGLPAFVALQMPTPPAAPAQPDTHIELTRGPTTIIMRWPASQAGACATWLREMLLDPD